MKEKSIMTPNGKFEIYCNSGNLFKNDSDNPSAPLYKGLVNIDGRGYDLAIWKNDKGFLNTKFTEHKISEDGTKQEYSYNNAGQHEKNLEKHNTSKVETTEKNKDEFDDDIPF